MSVLKYKILYIFLRALFDNRVAYNALLSYNLSLPNRWNYECIPISSIPQVSATSLLSKESTAFILRKTLILHCDHSR